MTHSPFTPSSQAVRTQSLSGPLHVQVVCAQRLGTAVEEREREKDRLSRAVMTTWLGPTRLVIVVTHYTCLLVDIVTKRRIYLILKKEKDTS